MKLLKMHRGSLHLPFQIPWDDWGDLVNVVDFRYHLLEAHIP